LFPAIASAESLGNFEVLKVFKGLTTLLALGSA
jgi:hypothetical protein